MWGYLTAGVVAVNVAANIVNNANSNNNNNNNNNNQNSQNSNNENVGNSANSNSNSNSIVPGKRALSRGRAGAGAPRPFLQVVTGLGLGAGAVLGGGVAASLCRAARVPQLAGVRNMQQMMDRVTSLALASIMADFFPSLHTTCHPL